MANGDTLMRVSLTTGRVAGSRAFSRSIAGRGTASRRTRAVGPSGTTPELVGVLDGGAWINSLAFAGGPVRIDLQTLKVTAKLGRAGLPALVLDGVVVANSSDGWRCVDPVTGRLLARIPAVVAVEGTTAYVQTKRGGIPEIHRVTLDPRCRAAP